MDRLARTRAAEPLFVYQAADGARWEYVVLGDQGCALLRNRERVVVGDASRASVEHVLDLFLAVSSRGLDAAPPPPRAVAV
jgi:hypothetical protein